MITPDIEILSISALTASLKALIEDAYPVICVTGEVSNFKHHSSGHMYFSLKDERNQIRCVMWRRQNQALSFLPQDGMQVIALGKISVYEVQGQYQLVAHRLQPAGEGALQAAFEQLKARLAAEGLFDETRKQSLPPFPERVGVVTSATGAAIRDIIRVLHRRAPWVDIILRPVRVQGEGAAAEIATAIDEMNLFEKVDVVIVGRGGGSIEDLWAFNEELVVRAIVKSHIPVVSAVGHEVDVTLSDLAADMRAPTPSGAAELVVRDRLELLERIGVSAGRLHGAMMSQIMQRRRRLASLVNSYGFRRPMDLVGQRAQRVDELTRRLLDRCARQIDQRTQAVTGLIGRLNALNPLAVLERGYAVCRIMPKGVVVSDTGNLSVGDRLDVTLHRGRLTCRVEQLNGDAPRPERKSREHRKPPSQNLSLGLFDE